MGRPIKKTESSTIDTAYGSSIGGTIGKPYSSTGVYTIDFQYNANGTQTQHGYAYKQVGKNRFWCGNSASIGTSLTLVTLANTDVANLTANTASIICYNTSGARFYAKRITSHHVWDWNDTKYAYDIQTAATATYANVATY
jgi:hypothetical protein